MDKSILDVVHDSAKGLYDAGLTDSVTMHDFDAMCLPPIEELTPRMIKTIRLKEKVSQAVFAKYLNTSVSTVRQWEQGDKRPRGTSLRLLSLVSHKGLNILV